MKVLIATEKPFAPIAVDRIKEIIKGAGFEPVLLEKYTSKADLLKAVEDADGMIVRSDKVDREVLDAAKNLKIVVRAGAGYDNLDLKACSELGIVAENTPGQNSNAVAELVFGLAVMAARNMYDGTSGFELKGKRLGLQAFGQVGRNVARIAKGFGMEVSAFDPYCPDSVMEEAGVKPIHSIEDLYSDNDFVSIHIPATPETIGSIGLDHIKLMPKKAVLINTARKEVINHGGEKSLEKALEMRPDIKYMADVRSDNSDKLAEMFADQVFFTPKKMGAQTSEANINAGIAAANQIVDFLQNGTVRFKVN